MPTLSPAKNLVPRWRIRMLPASTASPPNFLTPRRWPGESRPLRDEPPDFLCAMAFLLRLARLGRFRRRLGLLGRRRRGGLGLGRRLGRRGLLGIGPLGFGLLRLGFLRLGLLR